ncbi:MAG TPA: molybdopterin molybdenumtransferase MoeA, partial [Verrucomicrobia bacterium]|nr:molybdopterin molybdenumtransferase MoeA [Verrucomicrobiota bacterium]
MHTLEQARAEMLEVIAPLPAETAPLAQAAGRVLAAEVRAA